MTIIRAPRGDRFTVVNRTVISDDRLSYRALGLLVYLIDKPDNWRVEAATLAHGEGREGREAVQTALKELREIGYLVRRRYQNDRGHWITESLVYETPGHTEDGFPVAGTTDNRETDAGSADAGFSVASLKTENEDGERTLSSSPPSPRARRTKREVVDEAFEEWWVLYPKKKAGKGQARERWRKMTVSDRVDAMLAIPRHVLWWMEHETDEQFIPAGNVWLNQRRWEDDEPRSVKAVMTVVKPSMADRVLALYDQEPRQETTP